MGNSRQPSPPKPKKIKPVTYQQVEPMFAYKQAADYLSEIRRQTNEINQNEYLQAGTPAQVGALQSGTKALAAASYLSSIPRADRYIRETTGSNEDPYAAVRSQAAENLSAAQVEYGKALAKIDETPRPLDESYVPSWAKQTIKKGMTPANMPSTSSGG